jgi:hypothetical protein
MFVCILCLFVADYRLGVLTVTIFENAECAPVETTRRDVVLALRELVVGFAFLILPIQGKTLIGPQKAQQVQRLICAFCAFLWLNTVDDQNVCDRVGIVVACTNDRPGT